MSSALVARIRSAVTKRVLGDLTKKAEKEPDDYAKFWDNFGAVLKEGLYEDQENRDELLKLVRFRSTHGDKLVSLDDYVGRMKPGQQSIYYISGEEIESVARSPQLEGFRAKGVEVLLLTDAVDDFWIPTVGACKEKPFRSATRAGAELGAIEGDKAEKTDDEAKKEDVEKAPGIDSLLAMFKLELGDKVKDVRVSERLTDSPVCLVADDGDIDIHLERLLRQHRQMDSALQRVLEVNPSHALIRALAGIVGQDGAGARVREAAWLLLDQARILEGETPADPAAFTRRLADVMTRGLTTAA